MDIIFFMLLYRKIRGRLRGDILQEGRDMSESNYADFYILAGESEVDRILLRDFCKMVLILIVIAGGVLF